jgi:hypothetical protein
MMPACPSRRLARREAGRPGLTGEEVTLRIGKPGRFLQPADAERIEVRVEIG